MNERARYVLILTAGFLLLCHCAMREDPGAEKARLQSVMDSVNRAWESGDTAAFSQLLAHDEDVVGLGADVDERWVGWPSIQAGLTRQFQAFSRTKVVPRHVDIHISATGRAAWLTQVMDMSTELMGTPVQLEARFTAVFEKRNGRWLLVQFHYSVPVSESRRLTS
jgi:uncharacterized protein (TIGR02246 family)